jgi:hypothetical protein
MSAYNWETREYSLTELHPELRKAIVQNAKRHRLGDVESQVLICCQTMWEPKPMSFMTRLLLGFPSCPPRITAAAVTPSRLILAEYNDKDERAEAFSAPFEEMVIEEDPELEGIDISSPLWDESIGETNMMTWVLGPGPATRKFKGVLQQSIERANKSHSA